MEVCLRHAPWGSSRMAQPCHGGGWEAGGKRDHTQECVSSVMWKKCKLGNDTSRMTQFPLKSPLRPRVTFGLCCVERSAELGAGWRQAGSRGRGRSLPRCSRLPWASCSLFQALSSCSSQFSWGGRRLNKAQKKNHTQCQVGRRSREKNSGKGKGESQSGRRDFE